MKKNIKTSLPLFLLLSLCCFAQAQYVTLQGKQFKDASGNDFYPVVVNYEANIAHINDGTSASDFAISPSAGYGTNSDYDYPVFSASTERIRGDFKKIKEMGFNTIRLTGITPSKIDGSNEFTIESGHFPDTYQQTIVLHLYAPYSSDFITQNVLLPKIGELLDIAEQETLKVILLSGGGFIANSPSDVYPSTTIADANSQQYASYLSVLSTYLQNKPALLAYDMFNEPHWNKDINGNYYFTKVKSKVCEYVGMWYQAIKDNDQNHLITMGACGPEDVMDIDPALVKVDFLSEHFYPGPVEYEGYGTQEPNDRISGMLNWFNNNLPMPWIVGETGFSASRTTVGSSHGVVDALHNTPPYVFGTIDQQKDYAILSQQLVLDYGGSGYSWWDFADKSMYGVESGSYLENFFGLLYMEDPVLVSGVYTYPPEADKLLVTDAFGNNIPTVPGTPTVPSNYYNPFNHPINNNLGCHISGAVTDQNGHVIKDAVVQAWTDLGSDPNTPYDNESNCFYSFTNSTGEYLVNAYNYKINNVPTLPTDPSFGQIANLQISALGAERLNWGWWGGTLNSVISPTLHKIDLVNNLEVTGQNISGPQNYQAWNTIAVSNTNIQSGGSSDIKARYSIDVQPEFHAYAGSEVHIYCETVYADCFDFSGFQMQRNAASTTTDNNEQSNSIEIQFKKNSTNPYLSVSPNPSNGFFQVQLIDGDENNKLIIIKVHDITGRILKTIPANSKTCQLDLSLLPKGVYFIKASDLNQQFNYKIIIQ